jgi:hypothetical protein
MRSPVIVIGRFAFKFARDRRGRASNLYEAKLFRAMSPARRALLCPVIWVSRNGAVQIMRAATPLTDMMTVEEYEGVIDLWDYICPEKMGAPSNQRHPTGDGSRGVWSRLITRLRHGNPTRLVPLKTLERALSEQSFGSDVPIFDFGGKRRFDPDRLGLFNRLGQFRFWAHDRVELFPDLA